MNREPTHIGVSQVDLPLPGRSAARVWFAAAADRTIPRTGLLSLIMARSALCGSDVICSIRLDYGTLGRPHVWIDDRPGPGVSFSHMPGMLWAAVSDHHGVGIDVSHPTEFTGRYPLSRIAQPAELAVATRLAGSHESAAALLWAVKEAAAKASGRGFHGFDFREVLCGTPSVRSTGFLFPVCAGRPAVAWAVWQADAWVAIAANASEPPFRSRGHHRVRFT